jgi:hypothetical protein
MLYRPYRDGRGNKASLMIYERLPPHGMFFH